MTRGSTTRCASIEPCGDGGKATRLGVGQRRDRIELVKVSTAFNCLGGDIGTERVTQPATRRSAVWGAVNREAARLSSRRSVAYEDHSSPRWLTKTSQLYN